MLEIKVARLGRHLLFGCPRVLAERALTTSKDLIARLQARDAFAHRFHLAGEVDAGDSLFRLG